MPLIINQGDKLPVVADGPQIARMMVEADATRRSPFNPRKRVSSDSRLCDHVWLRFGIFDECKFCEERS